MADNSWLYRELSKNSNLRVSRSLEELISVRTWWEEVHNIYCPDHSEYMVTVDTVQKVIEIGGSIISYPSSWCSCSMEARRYAVENGVIVMPHGETFEFMKKWAVRR